MFQAPDPFGEAKPVALKSDRRDAAAYELGYVSIAPGSVEALEDPLFCRGPTPPRREL